MPKTSNRWFVVLLIALLLLVIVVTSLQTMTPDQIFTKTKANMQQVKTMNLSAVVELAFMGQSSAIQIDGGMELPDKALVDMKVSDQSIQMLVRGASEVYARMDANSDWQQIDFTSSLDTLGMDMDFISQQSFWNQYANPQWINEEDVDGVACYHLSYTVDLREYFTRLVGSTSSGISDFTGASGKGELWIGKKDLRIHKNMLNTSITLQYLDSESVTQFADLSAKVTTAYSKFDEPVSIPEP